MKLSHVIVTHNRREALLRTLSILHWNPSLPVEEVETWVVDNGSTDGTIDVVRRKFPDVHVIQRPTNEGVWARNYAFEEATGEYVMLLDDDSYPVEDAAARSVAHLDQHSQTAAVVGRVEAPGGMLEACALPSVMLSGAVCIRRSVLQELGGFRREFFRKAGEYDLSFRIWQAGHCIERFEDIVYRHEKVPTGRSSSLAHRMDVRNNLILVERYLPAALRGPYRADWTRRYALLARHAGQRAATRRGRRQARAWAIGEMWRGRQTLDAATCEIIFEHERQALLISEWAERHQARHIVIVDYSKNVYATWRACREAGLTIVSMADDHPAMTGRRYRGLRIRPTSEIREDVDGVVLSNINPAQIDNRFGKVREHYEGPILRLWHPRRLDTAAEQETLPIAQSA